MSTTDPTGAHTVRLTDQAAIANLRIVLESCAGGQLRASATTRRPAAATVSALAVLLADRDFYPDEAISAYAWPLLVQAGDLAEVVGGRLRLTRRGTAALAGDGAAALRDLWRRWISSGVIDEFSRVEHIKGQRVHNVLTSAKTRRQAVASALAGCPVGEWVHVEDLFARMRRAGHSPSIVRSERAMWRLYIAEAQYGSLGYAGHHGWALLEGRYTLAVLFEYAATLGLIDVAYDHPAGARDDFRGNWGADDLDYLSRYDGLRALRLNPLGAWITGIAAGYLPAAPVAVTGSLKVLPNCDVVSLGELTHGEQMTLSAFAQRTTERVWRLDTAGLLAAVSAGRAISELGEFLTARAGGDLPQPVRVLLDDVTERAGLLTDLGPTRLVRCRDAAVATLLSRDPKIATMCQAVGDTYLAVAPEHEAAFRARLTALGHVLARSQAPAEQ
jgi:hypothetical protein